MKNSNPIFLNCFSRGGSNILWNLFLSHPDVCSPIKETLELFRFDRHNLTIAGGKAIWLSRQWHLFDQWYLQPRSPVTTAAQQFVDHTLDQWKSKTVADPEMHYKSADATYTIKEVNQARLVAKNNNGLTFLSDMFYQMYPRATFIALIRDPIALYESYKRRKISRSLADFTVFYAKLAERMFRDSNRLPHYHIIRFEDLLAQPYQMIVQLYEWTGLDLHRLGKVRLKAKAHLQADGHHWSRFREGHHFWFELDQLHAILESNINHYQADNLVTEEKSQLMRSLGELRERLGYQ